MKQLVNFPFHKKNKIKTFGNSMAPLLINGDLVYFNRILFKDINVNDIIIFQKFDKYITHRVIYKTSKYLITKGDNNLKEDPSVYKKDIVGKLEKVVRNGIEFNPEVFYQVQSTIYSKEIKNVTDFFREKKIKFVFLKGLPVHIFYKNGIPRRIYNDCDILIYKKELDLVIKYFSKLGYKPVNTGLYKKILNNLGELSFYKNIKNIFVIFDIHIEPVFMMTQINVTRELYSISLVQKLSELFLNQRREIIIDKRRYPILKPAFLIIYLSIHFFHHNFTGIFRLSFIHAVISKENTRKNLWKDILAISDEYQLQNFIYPVLLLLRKYYKTEIPDKVVMKMRPHNYLQKKIGENFVSDSVFRREDRLFGGINRLLLLILLSKNSFYKKISLVVNREVWELFFNVLKKALK
jgi:hypothetical protein